MEAFKILTSISEEELLSRIEATSLYDAAKLREFKEYDFRCVVSTPPLLKLVDWNVRKCAVVNFPHGLSPLSSVEYEMEEAFESGAAEVDVPISPTLLRLDVDKYREYARSIIGMAKERGFVIKLIIEAPMLSDDEMMKVVKILKELEPDFVKTSTGIFSKTSPRDVLLIKYFAPSLRIKAAGGIKRFADVVAYISMGVNTIGTSSAINIIEEYRRFRRMI